MKRATLATIKSFVRKSEGLHISVRSRFDGMCDGVRRVDNDGFTPVESVNLEDSYRLGIPGAWFVRGSRDWFTPYAADGWAGWEVSNCCGTFVLAVRS